MPSDARPASSEHVFFAGGMRVRFRGGTGRVADRREHCSTSARLELAPSGATHSSLIPAFEICAGTAQQRHAMIVVHAQLWFSAWQVQLDETCRMSA
eukprot:2786216-Prymnesium_polylepis.1